MFGKMNCVDQDHQLCGLHLRSRYSWKVGQRSSIGALHELKGWKLKSHHQSTLSSNNASIINPVLCCPKLPRLLERGSRHNADRAGRGLKQYQISRSVKVRNVAQPRLVQQE